MRRNNRISNCALWLLLTLAGGCSSSVKGSPDLAPAFRSQILFSDSQQGLDNGVFATKFQFAYLRDLYVRVTISDTMPHVSVLSLEFSNPIGEPFYLDMSRFSPDPEVKEMMIPALGHPLPVFRAKPIKGGLALDRSIAIGGATFQKYPSPDGVWEVRATLEGVPGMLSAPLDVTMGR